MPKMKPETRERVRNLIGKDRSDTEIAEQLKLSETTVARVRNENLQPSRGVDPTHAEGSLFATGDDSRGDSIVISTEDAQAFIAQEPKDISPASNSAIDAEETMVDGGVGNTDGLTPNATPPVTPDGPPPDDPPIVEHSPIQDLPQTWLLATNHLNMVYMLGTGLLMGPAGFDGKHYRDPTDGFPGRLPLFRGTVPEPAIQNALDERKTLRPCLAEVDIKGLRGAVHGLTRDGALTGDVMLSGEINAEVCTLLLPAPLPVDLVKKLWFGSEAAKKDFVNAAGIDPTIRLDGLPQEPTWPPATAIPLRDWPPAAAQDAVVAIDLPPARGQAIGGALAMLYHMANRSELLGATYRIAAGERNHEDVALIQHDPVLKELPGWLSGNGPLKEAAEAARLYWGAADAMIQARIAGSTSNAIDTVLNYLGSPEALAAAPTSQSRLAKLTAAMRDAFGMARGTITELFASHRGSLSRPLLLLCLRERGEDLLEFSHAELKDEELALAAILFGIREGWRRLPKDLRLPDSLARHVIQLMVEVEQRQRGRDALRLEPAMPHPQPLRELIPKGDDSRNGLNHPDLVQFVRKHKWDECLVTCIILPVSWDIKTSPRGSELMVEGVLQGMRYEVHRERLLERIAQWPPLPREIEVELRDLLAAKRS